MSASEEKNDAVIQGCAESCARLLLAAKSLSPAQYCKQWNEHNGIGPHLRHCYEHLAALRDGLDSGTVNYDARKRDVILEEDPVAFIAAMTPIVSWLEARDPKSLDTPLIVCQIPRVDAPETRSDSTLRRELLFLTSHTIHHLAIVTILAELQGVVLPLELGVAYSTTTHEHQQRGGASATVANA